jgi:predicted metal-dependent phosphoesterase TrpH
MRVSSYLEAVIELQLEAACLTNHGDMRDFDHLSRIAPASLALIPGVEISSEEGDFLIYSTDYDFLDSLIVMQSMPEPGNRPEETAIVWAHPFAGMRLTTFDEEYIESVARRIDGIEVFNGNWLDPEGVELARSVADRYGLAELGSSDAHRRNNLLRCWTEADELGSVGDLVAAIHAKKTRAVCPQYEG